MFACFPSKFQAPSALVIDFWGSGVVLTHQPPSQYYSMVHGITYSEYKLISVLF